MEDSGENHVFFFLNYRGKSCTIKLIICMHTTPNQVTLQLARVKERSHDIPAGKLGSITTSNRSRPLDWLVSESPSDPTFHLSVLTIPLIRSLTDTSSGNFLPHLS